MKVSFLISQYSKCANQFTSRREVTLPYTATKDCFVEVKGTNQAGTNGYYIYFQINGLLIYPFSGMTPINWQVSHCFHMRKGETLSLQEGAGLAYWGVFVTD